MSKRISMPRSRVVLSVAIAFTAILAMVTTFAAIQGRDDEASAPLGAAEGECTKLDVSPYNSIMEDRFTPTPFMAFDVAGRNSTYGSDYTTCETTPDLDNLCAVETKECTSLLDIAVEHDLWISIDYDCDGFCGLTEEQIADIPEKKEAAGWDWAVPSFAIRQLAGEDGMNGGTYYGELISVYQYENLQITIDLELGYAHERAVTEDELDRYDEDLQRFVTVNQALAEDIRAGAIERRDSAA